MRKPLIAGNFKMFKTVHETVSYIGELRQLARDISAVDIVVAPPRAPRSSSARRR